MAGFRIVGEVACRRYAATPLRQTYAIPPLQPLRRTYGTPRLSSYADQPFRNAKGIAPWLATFACPYGTMCYGDCLYTRGLPCLRMGCFFLGTRPYDHRHRQILDFSPFFFVFFRFFRSFRCCNFPFLSFFSVLSVVQKFYFPQISPTKLGVGNVKIRVLFNTSGRAPEPTPPTAET